MSFLHLRSSQRRVSSHFPRDQTPALAISRDLFPIPLHLINNSTCWPKYTFFNDLGLFGFIHSYYPLSSWPILARINCMVFCIALVKKHLCLFRSSRSKKIATYNVFKKEKGERTQRHYQFLFLEDYRQATLMNGNLFQCYLSGPVPSYHVKEKKSFMSHLDASVSLYAECRADDMSSAIFFMYYLINCLDHA